MKRRKHKNKKPNEDANSSEQARRATSNGLGQNPRDVIEDVRVYEHAQSTLPRQDIEILGHSVEGFGTKQIALIMSLSERYVKERQEDIARILLVIAVELQASNLS